MNAPTIYSFRTVGGYYIGKAILLVGRHVLHGTGQSKNKAAAESDARRELQEEIGAMRQGWIPPKWR